MFVMTSEAPTTDLCCPPLVEAPLGESDADELALALKALADPVRLRLVSIIAAGGEACACDLPAAVERTQPTVSHHLSILVNAGIIEREQRGKWAWFRLRPEMLDAIRTALRPIYEPAAAEVTVTARRVPTGR
jgi:ArsR family transcriptional regulator, arsenate/arsenite/antimonite-responsive transcriptional repressor